MKRYRDRNIDESSQTLEIFVKQRIGDMKRFRDIFVNSKKLMEIYRAIEKGELRIRDPSPPRDIIEYMLRLDYSLWFWTTVFLIALTLISIELSGYIPLFKYLRYVLGSLFVLFIPGYVTIEALYPRKNDLSSLERLALSIGLSLAIVPLIGLILNYTPWGIRLNPILVALTLYSIAIAIVAIIRKYRLEISLKTVFRVVR